MLKKQIKYIDLFTGTEKTETFYFNLTKAEMTEMELGLAGNGIRLSEHIKRIVEEVNEKEIYRLLKEIILAAYGERTNDGKFVKTPENSDIFSHTEAFSALLEELGTNADAAAAFLNGITASAAPVPN